MNKIVENPPSSHQLDNQSTSNTPNFWWDKTITYSKNNYFLITSIITLILIISITLFFFIKNSSRSDQLVELEISGSRDNQSSVISPSTTSPQSSPSPSPTPTTLKPDDGVKGTYNISQGKHDGPTISQVIFDPLDAKKDQLLTITLRVLSSTPADKITATLQTDTSTEDLTFTKSSTDSKYEIWTSTITLPESVLYKYILTATLQSKTGSTQVIVAPRS